MTLTKIFIDQAYLRRWFYENELWIISYIERNFSEASWQYQYDLMSQFLFFTSAIIEDDKIDEETKKEEIIRKLSYGKSKIVTIVGARGSGKTATALWLAEQVKENGGHSCIYYVGEPEYSAFYPPWIRFIKTLDAIPNGAFTLIDEAAIRYNARRFMKEENLDLTSKMVILRHQNISLVLITQNLEMIDINIKRLSDIIIYKIGSDYGIKRKRGEGATKLEREITMTRQRLKPRKNSECLAEYLNGPKITFRKFEHELPTFWDEEKISKTFKNYKKEKKEVTIEEARMP